MQSVFDHFSEAAVPSAWTDLTRVFGANLNVVFNLEKGVMSAFGQKRTFVAPR